MQHLLRNALVALAAVTGVAATAAESHVRILGENLPAQPQRIIQQASDILVEEDFSLFPEGTYDEPGVIIPWGAPYLDTPIDSVYTQQPGWSGYGIYGAQGGGYMMCRSPYNPSYLNVPMGDYSGTITITCRVRSINPSWGDMGIPTGTSLDVIPFAYGSNVADTDIPDGLMSFRLYEKNGWAELTMQFQNYTADNEGYIQFMCDTDLLIDNLKITTTPDFVASPTMLKLSNVTEDSFTINWMPVRKAFSYWVHLFTLDGYDDNGDPKFKRVYPDYYTAEDIQELEEMVETGEMPEAYLGYDTKECSYTFTDLDPEEEYYYAVQSHLQLQQSSLDTKYHAMFVAAPELLNATEIDKNAGTYVANWTTVAKGDGYEASNYGVYNVKEDAEDFSLLDEDFSGLDSDASGLADMEKPLEGVNQSDFLSSNAALPGWTCNNMGFANGMAGVAKAYNGFITTPPMYVANNDYVTLSLGVEMQYAGQPLGITFGGVQYQLTCNDVYTMGEFVMPTNGMIESPIRFFSADGQSPFLLDYVVVTQDVKEGNDVYVFRDKKNLEAGTSSIMFENCDFSDYDDFAFQVFALHYYYNPVLGVDEICNSPFQGRKAVDGTPASLENVANTGVEDTLTNGNDAAAYYDLTGRRVNNPESGVFIKVQNGKAMKVRF